MIYRLLALDLDGTLIGDNETFSPRVRRAVAAAQARGARVTIATGRSPVSTRPFARDLGIVEPLICYQGGQIVQPDGQVLHRVALRRDLAAQVLALAQERGWHVVLYVDGLVYATELRFPIKFYEAMINPGTQLVSDLSLLLDRDPDKVLLVVDEPAQAEPIYAELQRRFCDRMEIVRSHALFVEANPPGVDKGAGLAWLADHLAVPQAQVMAVGDQDNDAPMVAWAGLGVAMGNASSACKAAADWTAPPLSEDGAAVAIERFVLNK
jgi:Cof subfamily protein (haloacid dehalogenase superfamily)